MRVAMNTLYVPKILFILRCTISCNSASSACCYMRNDCKYLFQLFDCSSISQNTFSPKGNAGDSSHFHGGIAIVKIKWGATTSMDR